MNNIILSAVRNRTAAAAAATRATGAGGTTSVASAAGPQSGLRVFVGAIAVAAATVLSSSSGEEENYSMQPQQQHQPQQQDTTTSRRRRQSQHQRFHLSSPSLSLSVSPPILSLSSSLSSIDTSTSPLSPPLGAPRPHQQQTTTENLLDSFIADSSSRSNSSRICLCEEQQQQRPESQAVHQLTSTPGKDMGPSQLSSPSFPSPLATSSKAKKEAESHAATLPPIIPSSEASALRKRRTLRRLQSSKQNVDAEAKYAWDKETDKLGEGAYSSVYKATLKADPNEVVALKEISKEYTDHMNFQQEIEAMLYIQQKGGHPHLMGLHEHFETDKSFILVLDFVQGGELFEHLIQMGAYSELDASRIIRDIASALNFLHGIGIVHADLKPENVLLSTSRRGDSVIKVADFGTAVFVGDPLVNDDVAVDEGDDDRLGPEPCYGAPTPAYSPPEAILRAAPINPSMDMWALGVILFIMLTGCHPYDVSGESTDEEIESRIKDRYYRIPLRNKQIAGHLSPSAKDLIKKLISRDPSKRLTAYETLQHPWVRGETAETAKITGSDKMLSHYNILKTKMQVKFFENAVKWSDERGLPEEEAARRKVSLIERSFKELDSDQRGFLVTADIIDQEGTEDIVESGGPVIHMSDFENLLSENMKNKYYPAGHVVYREGDTGNSMYFLESGSIEVVADGTRAIRTGGDFFGEGALLHSDKKRSGTVKCLTPVHAYEISREYFEKYIQQSSGLYLTLKEKDKIRKRNRAKTILRMQKDLKKIAKPRKAKFFKKDEDGDTLFIVESGKVDLTLNGKTVFSCFPGNFFGEHSVMLGAKRNCDAQCVSKEGCIAQELPGETFRDLVQSSPTMQQALKELQYRREFKKAVVLRTRKEFPYENPEEAFKAATENDGTGRLDLESLGKLMRELNPDYTDEDIKGVLSALDLTESGQVSFDEMKKALIGDVRTSASM